jgi:hypothetical protein
VTVAEALDLAGRLAVAGAFAWAAVGKLADLANLRATLYLSRLTRPWVPQLVVLLPATELALAGALFGAGAGWVAALAAALLLVAFVAYLALDPSAAQGCHCFGGRPATSRRAGIVRDLLLLGALLPALVRGPGAGRWGVPVSAATLAAAGAVVVIGAVLLIGRQRGPVGGRRRSGVPPVPTPVVRQQAPAFDVRALDGTRLLLAELAERPGGVLLIFTEPGCAQCEALLPDLTARAEAVVLAAVEGEDDVADTVDVVGWAAAHGLAPERTGVDVGGAIADAYRVPGVPAACRVDAAGLLVDAMGHPARRPVVGPEAVRALAQGSQPPSPPPSRLP